MILPDRALHDISSVERISFDRAETEPYICSTLRLALCSSEDIFSFRAEHDVSTVERMSDDRDEMSS